MLRTLVKRPKPWQPTLWSVKYRLKYQNCNKQIKKPIQTNVVQFQVWDGPDAEGKDYQRPGRLTDRIYGPYRNDVEARVANNGALPPDLTFIVLGRKGGEDYIYHLLLYYCDPPAGVKLGEGQAYNPFFDGVGGIGKSEHQFHA